MAWPHCTGLCEHVHWPRCVPCWKVALIRRPLMDPGRLPFTSRLTPPGAGEAGLREPANSRLASSSCSTMRFRETTAAVVLGAGMLASPLSAQGQGGRVPSFEMVAVQPGSFLMGSAEGDADERPVH